MSKLSKLCLGITETGVGNITPSMVHSALLMCNTIVTYGVALLCVL